MKRLTVLMVAVLFLSGCAGLVKSTDDDDDDGFTRRADALELIDSLREAQNLKSVEIQSKNNKSGAVTIKIKVELYDNITTESF